MVSPSPHYKCHLQFHFLFTKYKVGIHAEVNGSHTHTTKRVPIDLFPFTNRSVIQLLSHSKATYA